MFGLSDKRAVIVERLLHLAHSTREREDEQNEFLSTVLQRRQFVMEERGEREERREWKGERRERERETGSPE